MSLYRWYRWFRKNNRYVYAKWHLPRPTNLPQPTEGQSVHTLCGRATPKRCGEEWLFDGMPTLVSWPYRLADVCPDCLAIREMRQPVAAQSSLFDETEVPAGV